MRKCKIHIIVFFLCSVFSGLIGLSGAAAEKKAKYVLKMGTVMPDAAFASKMFREEFIDLFESKTNGEVTVIMYWGGIMGDEEDYITKMRIDQLQGCILSVGGVLMACPEMGVLQLPFMFNNYDEVDYIRQKLGARFTNIYKKNGYKLIAWMDQDFDQIYSTKYEMKTPEDFKKSRFLTHAGTIEIELIKALGASPIPVGVPEVVPSFRAGVCDTVISPAAWWLGSQLYTITKYVNPYTFRYSPATIVFSNKAWSKLPAKHRRSLDGVFKNFQKKLNEIAHDMNAKCLKAMIEYGIKEVKMSQEEIEVFKKRTKPMWFKLVGKMYTRELLDEIVHHLKVYRSRNAKKG